MKLRGLHLHGFKSFADSTDIDFHEGVTAIVGPNGCGKSNISDAIRWVLGEQRPTAIRGAKMEEAIFQGSVNRRPVNRGSVRMKVSNEDGSLPLPYEEVEIGRTVFRDGGSDYFINRQPSRLKDVVDLCRDTGLGANAYSVIENRMIDAILSDRADERRHLFEEAAGIGKYKDRRKTAIRRLERAEADLERLEDLIGEVQRKVRSLARQKGKAERWEELRTRRLSVEVAVVRDELEGLADRLDEVDGLLEEDEQLGEGMVAQLRTAEAQEEQLRLAQVEAEKARAEAAGALERVREELSRWERDLAVAEERATYAERRLAQIDDEREATGRRLEEIGERRAELEASRSEQAGELEGLREELSETRSQADEVRERLTEARDSLEGVENREREIARRMAQLEGDAESAEAQAAELERREEELVAELEAAGEALSDLESQGDLFADRVQVLSDEVEEARTALEARRGRLEGARETLERARSAGREAEDVAGSLRARLEALESMERERQGVEPAVRAALDAGIDGVVGAVTDFLSAPPELARAVEIFLGPLALGIVVRDGSAVTRVRQWFSDGWSEGGGLVLLPLDRAPEADGGSGGNGDGGGLLDRVDINGEGGPWARALLGGVEVTEDDELASNGGGSGPRIAPSGAHVDGRGIVHLGNPGGAAGVLERKEKIKELREALASAEDDAEAARRKREEEAEALRTEEEELESAREAFRDAEDRHREVRADAAAQTDRKDRMNQRKDEVVRQIEGTKASRIRALERGEMAREDRKGLEEEEEELREARQVAREALDRVQSEWESVRSEESALAVQVTRLEGEVSRIQERIDELDRSRDAAETRLESLAEEETSLRDELGEARSIRAEGEKATQELFERRDEAETKLREKDQALNEVAEALREAEQTTRKMRAAEREASDERHRLELERQELEGKIGRIQDRLEGEWGRPLEKLVEQAEPVEGTPEELREELREIVVQLETIGPVNMLAVEEHKEESQRLEFLTEQRDDLMDARRDLRDAIQEINETAVGLFMETFEKARENFRDTFRRLFQGGEADLWLEDPEDPLESPIEIHASPVGKKTQRIDLLSGGERALTALSLLFGIYLVKPSPFCVLDEVDAPLDENNIGRFIRLLQEFKEQSQFVVITHNPRTIESADWIYGVTMEEPGVSTIVGVQLQEALETSGTAA